MCLNHAIESSKIGSCLLHGRPVDTVPDYGTLGKGRAYSATNPVNQPKGK